LTSGAVSPYYFDGRLLTLDAEGAYHVGRAFQPIVRECGAEAVAGPAVAAIPMVSAISLTSHLDGHPVPGLIVRTETKKHGTGKLIEGSMRAGMAVAVVDDACTKGGSLLHAIDAVEAAGCRVVKVMCILDRNEGGSSVIRDRGYDFVSLLEANENAEIRVTGE
jgi:orotate phosphoribosyltransferase